MPWERSGSGASCMELTRRVPLLTQEVFMERAALPGTAAVLGDQRRARQMCPVSRELPNLVGETSRRRNRPR